MKSVNPLMTVWWFTGFRRDSEGERYTIPQVGYTRHAEIFDEGEFLIEVSM